MDGTDETSTNSPTDDPADDPTPSPAAPTGIPPPTTTFHTGTDIYTTLRNAVGDHATIELRNADGTTRRPDPADLAALDLQTKLRATAASVADLDPARKRAWAEGQRAAGNGIFRGGRYREALDVYLTCLVGADAGGEDGGDAAGRGEVERGLLLPVLLNLAACTQALGEHNKTIKFCTEALELSTGCGRESAKVWYRRGKAFAVTGRYREARRDYDEASARGEGGRAGEQIRAEVWRLDRLERDGRKNREVQRAAMQVALGGARREDGGEKKYPSLYGDVTRRRTRSTLTDRAPPEPAARFKREGGGNEKEAAVGGILDTVVSAVMDCFRRFRDLPPPEKKD